MAAACKRLVWRQRKAGICSTSTTAATGAACSLSWISVSNGKPNSCFTSAKISSPRFRPGPRKLSPALRFALSKLALNITLIANRSLIAFSSAATSSTNSRLSITQGPAIKVKGKSMAISSNPPAPDHGAATGQATHHPPPAPVELRLPYAGCVPLIPRPLPPITGVAP